MSVAIKLSRNSVANGGFGDPDLTPKPLRISKREHTRTSTIGTVNSSLSIHKSQTQGNLQALTPNRKCSSRVNSTQLDLSLQDLAAPTSQWARRNTFLHVHKQRQSEPISTNMAVFSATSKEPIGFSPFNPPVRTRDSCPAMGHLGSSSNASNAISVATPASLRAFTTGTYGRQNPLSPVHEVSSPPSRSSALRTRQRRAVTNVEAFYKDLDSFVYLPHRKLRKQSSTKNSLMSRVMSGLTNRNHINRAASRGGNDTADTLPESSPATFSRVRKEKHAFRQSDSSTETDTYCRRNPHQARAVYPTPPTSSATSSTTVESLDSRHSVQPKRFRELCKPADAILTGADLTLTPEYDKLNSEKERSIWVSLDIKGTTNSTCGVQDVWSQHTGLDIVVVIDNSLHTSPAALMASCETARFLASILNRVTDRLAILCTSVTHTGGADAKIVRGLTGVHMDEIKTYLDAIASSNEKLKTNAWTDTISCAKEILLKSTVPDPDEELLQDTFGHIFLLTADADGLSSQLLAHDELAFHVICPASVPRNDQAAIHCNGWKLRSLSGKETQVVSKKKDLDPTSVTNQLRILIFQARGGKLMGNLTELVLEVSAGPDCTVEGVIGNVKFTELHPGEVFTVLFRLKVCDAALREYSFFGTPTESSESLLSTKDVMSQLDTMLKATDAKIFTARLTYKHSLLPAGTTCSVTTECHVEKLPPDPDQALSPSTPDFLQARDCTIVVDQRLAYHLATQAPPRNALKLLYNEFGDMFQSSTCRDYITLLAEELKYQARIVERLEITASPKKPPAVPTPTSSTENCSQSPRRGENHRPQQRATSETPIEELFKTEPALAVLSVKKSREQLRTDEARRIWGDLRKMKKPANQAAKGRSNSSQMEEARRQGIRELAVKNKRSLGSDTIRSFIFAGDSAEKGVSAPWM